MLNVELAKGDWSNFAYDREMIRDTVLIPNGLNTWNEERYEMTGYINNINTANTQVLMEFHDKGYAGNIYEYAIGISNSYDKRESVSHWQNTNYYSYDGRGSVSGLVDPNGDVQMYHSYEPDGQTTLRFRGYIKNPYRYNAERVDYVPGIADFQYLRARYYAPNLGRFIQQDIVWGTIQTPLSQNLFIYCQNNAVNFIDPSGHSSEGYDSSEFLLYMQKSRDERIKDDRTIKERSTKLIAQYMGSNWKKLSTSETSHRVLEQIELAIHNSYKELCDFDKMTKLEFFNRATGPSISAFGIESLQGRIEQELNMWLDGKIQEVFYQDFFTQYSSFLKYSNLAYEYGEKYENVLSNMGQGDIGVALVDMILTGYQAYATGGSNIETIISGIVAGMPSPEPSPVSWFFDEVLGNKAKKERTIKIAQELSQTLLTSELRFVATESNVRKILISDIESMQDNIMNKEYKSLADEQYAAYQLFYLEEIKLLNYNISDSRARAKDIEKYITEKWETSN